LPKLGDFIGIEGCSVRRIVQRSESAQSDRKVL
jgi:hypothetical protein